MKAIATVIGRLIYSAMINGSCLFFIRNPDLGLRHKYLHVLDTACNIDGAVTSSCLQATQKTPTQFARLLWDTVQIGVSLLFEYT